jgi:uncharacterized lipoprotein YmbA
MGRRRAMKHGNFARFLAGMLGIAMLFQLGCAGRSREARFFVLTPEADLAPAMQRGPGSGTSVSIGISPVVLPKYLKKQQIVTRSGGNELQLAEFDRWAGKIEEDIGRVIAENLSRLLGTDRVLAYPAMENFAPDYYIQIEITRFDGRLGGDIELAARWSISDGRGKVVYGVRASNITEAAQGSDYEQLVAAQSRILAAFSRELAQALKELAGA